MFHLQISKLLHLSLIFIMCLIKEYFGFILESQDFLKIAKIIFGTAFKFGFVKLDLMRTL